MIEISFKRQPSLADAAKFHVLRTDRRTRRREKKAHVHSKNVLIALIKALCHEARWASKRMRKHASEAFQNPAWHGAKPCKIEAQGATESQNAA